MDFDSPAQRVVVVEEWQPRLTGLERAYMSTGVRIAWVKEQQTAPAKAYLGYSAMPLSLFNDLAVDGSGACWGIWAAVTRDGGDAGGTVECPITL